MAEAKRGCLGWASVGATAFGFALWTGVAAPFADRSPLPPNPTPNPDRHPHLWEATSVAEAKLGCFGWASVGATAFGFALWTGVAAPFADRSPLPPKPPKPTPNPDRHLTCGRPLLWPKRSRGVSVGPQVGATVFGFALWSGVAAPFADRSPLPPKPPKPTPNPDRHPYLWEATSVAEAKLGCFGWASVGATVFGFALWSGVAAPFADRSPLPPKPPKPLALSPQLHATVAQIPVLKPADRVADRVGSGVGRPDRHQ